jgi:hypothetical protein
MELIIFFIGLSLGLMIGVILFERSKKNLIQQSCNDMQESSRHLKDKTDMLRMMAKSNELMMRFNNGSASSRELLDILDEQSQLHLTISHRAKQDA